MRLLIFGAPGVGKGTQAKLIAKKLNIPHVSTGDLLRAAAASGSPLGRQAKAVMDAGHLVSDEIMIGIIKEVLASDGCKNGFILDGYPRTLAQAEVLDRILKELHTELDKVINIEVSEEEIIRRLSMRLSCKRCGRIYNVQLDMLADTRECRDCGGPLYQRDDDKEETVRNRLKVYRQSTAPVKEYYVTRGILKQIDGEGDPEIINNEIMSALTPQPHSSD
jgi:adenylate kinase